MDNTLFFCLSLTVLILVDKTLFRHYSPNVNKCEGPLCHSKENVQYCNNQVVRVREINDWVKSDDKQPLITTIPNHVWWSCQNTLKHLLHSFYTGYQCQNMSYNHPPYWRQKHIIKGTDSEIHSAVVLQMSIIVEVLDLSLLEQILDIFQTNSV